MLNFIKFLLSLFVLATSAQKGYCDSLDTIISLHLEEDHDKTTGIPHAPIRVPVIYIQQQNTQTFPGTFVIGFKVGGDGLKFNGVELDLNDRVELDRCSVYGAIKYKGRWLGARIIKDRD